MSKSTFYAIVLAASGLIPNVAGSIVPSAQAQLESRASVIAPKVMILSMLPPEAEAWYGISEFDVLAQNITVPGISPLYPDVHCTANGDVCQVTIGEAEINAAVTLAALTHSAQFDFTKTYFMIAGIAGVNPEVATTSSVAFARYAVQVGLEYEISQLELPANFSTSYIPLGSHLIRQYPPTIYGTEVFEFNKDLQQMAVKAAGKAKLADSPVAKQYRAKYAASSAYKAGASLPSVLACDSATSDTWTSGTILGQTAANFTKLMTNGTGVYCMTEQEDNGTAEGLLRAALQNLTDFSRIIAMRTASDFDRPYPGQAATTNLWWADAGALYPALKNIYNAGIEVVQMILDDWDSTFEKGVKPSNYVGDIFGSLGGTPDFGPYAYGNDPLNIKRSVPKRLAQRHWIPT